VTFTLRASIQLEQHIRAEAWDREKALARAINGTTANVAAVALATRFRGLVHEDKYKGPKPLLAV
jgi:hypothetical protein